MTSDLARRVWEHREGLYAGFSKRYGLKTLVHAERYDEIIEAIQGESTMKHWPRQWKVALMVKDNPGWDDMYEGLA